MEEVVLGTIVSTYGIKGEVKVLSCTDFAKNRYKKGNEVKLVNPNTHHEVTMNIASYKNVKGLDVISFIGFENINLIEKYVGYEVLINKPTDGLKKGSFYYSELIGCKVYNKDEFIGEVYKIIDTGKQQILRIKREGKKDLLYPFVEHFIEKIDVESKQINLLPIEGMID